MKFVRPLDSAQGFDTGFTGYRAQRLSSLESCLTILSEIQGGGCGPGLHTHKVNQLYYLLDGTMNVRLGRDVYTADAGTLVFIPRGLPHCNWNTSDAPESHFEVLLPAPAAGAPILEMVEEKSFDWSANLPEGQLAKTDRAALTEPLPGFYIQPLFPNAPGAPCVVNYCELDTSASGPGLHVHEFDQYYLVLEGELTVDVALQHHVVPADNLVLLPAGVPHRQYNAGPGRERHLALLAPAPVGGEAWDRGVSFEPNGEDHGGLVRSGGN